MNTHNTVSMLVSNLMCNYIKTIIVEGSNDMYTFIHMVNVCECVYMHMHVEYKNYCATVQNNAGAMYTCYYVYILILQYKDNIHNAFNNTILQC